LRSSFALLFSLEDVIHSQFFDPLVLYKICNLPTYYDSKFDILTCTTNTFIFHPYWWNSKGFISCKFRSKQISLLHNFPRMN
jgi:hypothetical protein